MKTESTWVERFYTHFLGRDLAYLFAGGLFVCVVMYALWAKIVLPQKLSLELAGFLLASYFIGMALSEFSDFIGIVSKKPALPIGYSNDLLLYQDLVKHYDPSVLNRLERTVYLMTVGASVGVSSLWGAIFMGILGLGRWIFKSESLSSGYIGFALCLAVYGIYMVIHSRGKIKEIGEQRTALVKGLPKNLF